MRHPGIFSTAKQTNNLSETREDGGHLKVVACEMVV